jgi:hypothetical protein
MINIIKISSKSILTIFGFSMVLVLSACNTPKIEPTSIPTDEPTATIAPTVPGPTYTPAPIPTLPILPTPVITESVPTVLTIENFITPTTEVEFSTTLEIPPGGKPQVVPIENSNCHIRPGREPNIVGYFLKGMTAEIYGIDPTGKWLMIPNPDRGGEFCWVWTGSTKVIGSLDNVRIIP